jgi:hypothetical protein
VSSRHLHSRKAGPGATLALAALVLTRFGSRVASDRPWAHGPIDLATLVVPMTTELMMMIVETLVTMMTMRMMMITLMVMM